MQCDVCHFPTGCQYPINLDFRILEVLEWENMYGMKASTSALLDLEALVELEYR